MAEEEEAAERKRKRKEKKKREAEAAAAAAAAASSGFGKNDDDPFGQASDPFAASVIPATVAAASGFDVPPVEEKKKKKKKDRESAAAAAPASAVAAASASSQYRAMASPQKQSSNEIDLTSFADSNVRSPGANAGSGDFDFLSGPTATGGDLTDMFGNTHISAQPTLWDQHSAGASSDEEDAFGSNSHKVNGSAASHSSSSSSHASAAPQAKKDTWSSDLFNLERLDQAPPQQQPKKAGLTDTGVTLSMMKGLNPNTAPTPKRNSSIGNSSGFGSGPSSQPGFGGPGGAFAGTGGFAAPSYGQAPPPPLGPQMMPPYGGRPHMGPMGGMGGPGYGYGQQPQMGYGQPQMGAMGGYGQPQMGMGMGMGYGQQMGGPMGMQQGYGQPQMGGPMGGYGAPMGSMPPTSPQSLDPFASLSSAKMGSSQSKQNNANMDFFVPTARK